MNTSQALGLLLLVLAAVALILSLLRRRRRPEPQPPATDIALWDAEDLSQRDFWPELIRHQQDETMPAVLSRPEWRAPDRD